MAAITSRQDLKDYALRRLGFPVIEINVDDDQVEDRVDDTFQYFFDYHYDGVEREFYAHQITQTDIDNGYITVPDSLIHVTRVLPVGYANGLFYPMGDPSLAWNSTSANPIFGNGPAGAGSQVRTTQDAAGGDMRMDKSTFYLNMASIEEFNQIIAGGEPTIRFSRHTDRVYIDTEFDEKLNPDMYLIVEGWASLDPEVYTQVYNDRWIKRYLTQMIKQQWGANLIKYSGILLPGNVTFDGDKLFDQASQEIAKLEEEMQLQYELPVDFYMG
jgi:hypothetical protein